MTSRTTGERGFTLIELLIVIGIIGFLAGAVLVAVDPVKRIQDSRDSRRSSEVNAILNAYLTKQVDDRALYAGEVTAPLILQGGSNVQVIVKDDTGIVCNSATTRPGCNKAMDTSGANKNCVANISAIQPNYIADVPNDPAGLTPCTTGSTCTTVGNIAVGTTNSGYYVSRTAGNRIEIGACKPEQAAAISVKR